MSEYSIQKGVELPDRPLRSDVGRLFNFFQAQAAGLRSACAWRKVGRIVVEEAEPVGFVVARVKQRRTIYGNEAAILESLTDGSYRVVTWGWFVYSFEQTLPRVKRTVAEVDPKNWTTGSVTI